MGQEQPPQPMQPAAGGKPTPMSPQGQPMAEWWKRAVAGLIDGIIVAIPSYIINTVLVIGALGLGSKALTVDPVTGQVTGGGGGFFAGFFGVLILTFVVFAVLIALYGGFFWGGEKGQTVGKMALKLRVVDEATGGPIGFSRGAIRGLIIGLLFAVCYLPGILDVLWPLWDPKRQAWHDKVAKSIVIDVG
jgi:uncharacterized RDD family membrane protein YckC